MALVRRVGLMWRRPIRSFMVRKVSSMAFFLSVAGSKSFLALVCLFIANLPLPIFLILLTLLASVSSFTIFSSFFSSAFPSSLAASFLAFSSLSFLFLYLLDSNPFLAEMYLSRVSFLPASEQYFPSWYQLKANILGIRTFFSWLGMQMFLLTSNRSPSFSVLIWSMVFPSSSRWTIWVNWQTSMRSEGRTVALLKYLGRWVLSLGEQAAQASMKFEVVLTPSYLLRQTASWSTNSGSVSSTSCRAPSNTLLLSSSFQQQRTSLRRHDDETATRYQRGSPSLARAWSPNPSRRYCLNFGQTTSNYILIMVSVGGYGLLQILWLLFSGIITYIKCLISLIY